MSSPPPGHPEMPPDPSHEPRDQDRDWQASASGQPHDPFAAGPSAMSAPPREALAGFWIRFAGALIDGLLLSIVLTVLGGVLGEPHTLVALALACAYFTYLHSTRAGQTVGQLIVGIRLLNARDGGEVSVGAALVRWAMSHVSSLVLVLGYLWMLWDPYRQTWHDKVAGTYVVRVRHFPAPASFGVR